MFCKVRKTVIYHALKAKFIDDVNSTWVNNLI